MKALAGFASALKVRFQDIEVGLDLDVEKGLADSGDLDTDLADLITLVGEAAAERNTAVCCSSTNCSMCRKGSSPR